MFLQPAAELIFEGGNLMPILQRFIAKDVNKNVKCLFESRSKAYAKDFDY
jgi:hypothetical protein